MLLDIIDLHFNMLLLNLIRTKEKRGSYGYLHFNMLLLNPSSTLIISAYVKDLHFNMLLLNHEEMFTLTSQDEQFTFQYASIKPRKWSNSEYSTSDIYISICFY